MMKYLIKISLFYFFLSCNSNSEDLLQKEIEGLVTVEKQTEFLENLYAIDQDIRNKINDISAENNEDKQNLTKALKKMQDIDKSNLKKLELYLKLYGHPSLKVHGEEATGAPFIIYHHQMDSEVRLRGFRYLYAALQSQDIDKDDMAFYLNRSYYDKFNGKRINWEGPFRVEEELDTLYKSLDLEPIIDEINMSMNESKKLKSLGLIGGTSWHSTIDYYKEINQQINTFFGNNTNPPLVLYTVNQALVHKYQIENNWTEIANIFSDAAKKLEAAGAEKLMFCANTPHKIYNQVQESIQIPIIHIADATAQEIKNKQINKVLFLGTKYTMTEPFVMDRIAQEGIEVLSPSQDTVVNELHRIIIEELTYGNILDKSKNYVLEVIEKYEKQGAKGVILGCTEFPLMIFEEDLNIPIFNTTEIHAQAGINFILENYLPNE